MQSVKEKAGAVVCQYEQGKEPLVLLVSSRKNKGGWVFPVGGVEPEESVKEAAARECVEESGYCVNLGAKLAESEAAAENGRIIRYTFYLATVCGETAVWETDRERRWVPVSEAAALLPDIFQNVARAAELQLLPPKQRIVVNGGMADERQRLKELLLAKSCRTGTFTLSSGKTSDFYIDGKQTTLDAEGGYLCGRLLFELIRQASQPVGGVGGMTLGADPLVTAVSIVSHLAGSPIPAFIVRKEAKGHGTGNCLEGQNNLQPGCAVVLLEDVVTTGGTLIKVIERVEQAGFKVALAATVVDREEGGAEALAAVGCPLHAVFTRSQLLA
ncbi:Orotate phosphoribosyltransferase [Candidatus Electronema halotolerans]